MKGEENKSSGQKRFERAKGLNRGQRQKQKQKARGPKIAECNIQGNRKAISLLDSGAGVESQRGETKTHLQSLSVSLGHGRCVRPQRQAE